MHKRSKHIDQRYHYIRELVAERRIKIEYIPTDQNVVDMFTKPLASDRFVKLRDQLMVILV